VNIKKERKDIKMARKYFDKDADLKYIEGKTVAVLGYGNQGRSQALNLRDSGINVIIGSPRKDDSEKEANSEGFKVLNIKEATTQADVLMLLLPDEVLPQIYEKEIKPYLEDGMVLSFASGYNVFYKMLDIPEFVDVVMVAPRMIGREVRELFLEGSGAPSLISVEQNSSGNARAIVLALAKGIGATRVAALESSCEEETIIDLIGEQAMGGSALFFTRAVYEVLSEAGCSPEAILMELYASGENIAVAKAIVERGMWNQLRFHSHTSQYGHQTRGRKLVGEQTKDILRSFIRDIKDGSFRDEWTKVQQDGMKEFDKVWEENLKHGMLEEEDKLYKLLGRRK
jgi:ketol-acid reductoisomerase